MAQLVVLIIIKHDQRMALVLLLKNRKDLVRLKAYSLIMALDNPNLLTWIRNEHRIQARVYSISIKVGHLQCLQNLSQSIMV